MPPREQEEHVLVFPILLLELLAKPLQHKFLLDRLKEKEKGANSHGAKLCSQRVYLFKGSFK